MEKFNHPGGCQTLGEAKDSRDTSQQAGKLKTIGHDEKKAALHDEMQRVNQLPANSSYALHRMRVLNKLMHLLSIQRTTSEDEELELLFAGLSM